MLCYTPPSTNLGSGLFMTGSGVQQPFATANGRNQSHAKKALKQIVAGGCAGLVEASIMHPLDVIKTRFQIQRGPDDPTRYTSILDCIKKIVRNEGLFSFYKGVLPPLLSEIPKRATKFFSFECYKATLNTFGYTGPWSLVLAGFGAGMTEGAFVTPFERTKVHLQAMRYRMSEQPSTWSAVKDIVRRNGFGPSGLYRGLSTTLARNGIWNAIYFGVYHNVKNVALDPQDTSITSRFLIGLMAGSMASVSNLPIDVAKSRIQGPQPQNHPNKYRKTLATIRIVFKEEGILALYKGLIPRVLRLGPGGAIMLIVYEQVTSFLG